MKKSNILYATMIMMREERKDTTMKTLKAAAIATIITVAIILATAIALPVSAERGFYAKEALVIGWDRIGETDLRIITVEDEEGNLLDFFDDEDFYMIGDVVILRMADMSDECEEGDEITDVMLIERLDVEGMMDWMVSKGLI